MLARQSAVRLVIILSTVIFTTQAFTGHALALQYDLSETYTIGAREPSGLTYDPEKDALWVVEDSGGGIYLVQKRGEEILGAIIFKSEDLEGIAYDPSSGGLFLAEERKRFIIKIDKKGKIIETIDVSIEYNDAEDNYGFEGVTYDRKSGHLFIVNEKNPTAVLEVTLGAEIVNSFDVDAEDLSGICLDPKTGNLLIISEESNVLMEYTKDGRQISSFTLEGVSKPEGIALDNDGNLYIVCEETQHLYVFTPRK